MRHGEELAEDLQGFLDDRAIRAKPANVLQRLTRWTTQNRAFVATAVISVCVAWLVSSIWILSERSAAIQQRDLAEINLQTSVQQRQRAEAGLDFALHVLDELLDSIDEGTSTLRRYDRGRR